MAQSPRHKSKELVEQAKNDAETCQNLGEKSMQSSRANLGCAPLILGICIIGLLGKFLPHESTRSISSTSRGTEPRKTGSEPRHVKPAASPILHQPQKPTDTDKTPSLERDKKSAKSETQQVGVVTNNIWDGSVWQVERYLKRTLHDPASFEAIEWNRVIENEKGYQVRCKFKVKNLLGVYVVQSKIFFLSKAGEVYAVKGVK